MVSVDTGEELGPEEDGELLVQGPQVMKGYLNNKEATDKTIVNDWLHSGDLAKWDREGNLFLLNMEVQESSSLLRVRIKARTFFK